MNIDQFAVMDAVVRLGSFSAASRELNRVQSAVSYSVKTLEEELGVALFSRETYRPTLTAAGEAIYRKARALLADAQEIELLSRELAQGAEAVVRFDLSPVCPLDLATPVLKRLAEERPHTAVRISMEVFGGETLVMDDFADLALTDLVTVDDRLEHVPWRRVALKPVVAPGHPMGDDPGRPLSRAEMLRHTQIVVGSTAEKMQAKSLGVQEGAPIWRVSDFSVKKSLILAGLGWGHMPEHLVAAELAAGRLRSLSIPHFPKQVANLCLVRKRWRAHGPVASELWARLLDAREKEG